MLQVVELPDQRVIDHPRLGGMTAHDSDVGFRHVLPFECPAYEGCGLAIEREQQHARSAFVEPVHGVHLLPDLVAKHLHRKTLLVRVDDRTVHEQPGRLVDRDQSVVAVEDRKHGRVVERTDGAPHCWPRESRLGKRGAPGRSANDSERAGSRS
jgi:hypothetical protein